MINFIKSHGDERVAEIEDQATNDFNIGKEKMIEREKTMLAEAHEKNLNSAEVKMKIERSALQNKERIDKMRHTSKLVDSLLMDAKVKMHAELVND